MNLRDKNLPLQFFYTLFLSFFCTTLFPSFRLIFFAPFLITVYYQKSFPKAIYYSLFVGLLIDFFSAPLRLGIHAFNYSLTTMLVYHQKRNLFSDNLATLPLMTTLFSFLSTLMQLILLTLFKKPLNLSFTFLFSDLLFMPLVDGLAAFCFFILIPLFFNHYRRKIA